MRIALRSPTGVALSVLPPRQGATEASRVVVMVAGNGLCKEVLDPVANALVDDFCVQLDLTGHGQSAKAGPTWKIEDYGRDVLSALDKFNTHFPDNEKRSVVALGHSMGSTALMFAAGLRPRAFQKAFLFEPITFPHYTHVDGRPVEHTAYAAMAAKRRRTFPNADGPRSSWRTKGVFKTWSDEAFDGYMRGGLVPTPTGEVELACDPEWEAANYRRDYSVLWPAIAHGGMQCDVTLIRGALSDTYDFLPDVKSTQEFMQRLHEHMGASALITVPDATHSFPMEQPDAFAQLTLN